MDAQIKLLQAMLRGDEPRSPENIRKAFNKDVLTQESVLSQSQSIDSTLNSLDQEIGRLNAAIERRSEHIQRVEMATEEARDKELQKERGSVLGSLQNLDSILQISQRLAEGYFTNLGLGDSQEINLIIRKLIEVTSRNEQLLVSPNVKFVQFLINESLVRSTPAGFNKIRLRLY